MAITTIQADQLAGGFRRYPISDHGKLRFQYGKATQGAVAGDDGSMVEMFRLPPGRKRILPWLSRYSVSALGASRVMKVGLRAYFDRSVVGGTAQAENDDEFMSGIDVSSATANVAWPITLTGMKWDVFSRDEIMIFVTITGGTIPAVATFEMIMAYIYE